MDIDRSSFPSLALNIIESISQSDFVAIDFEFSGVSANAPRSTGRGKDSLQDRYTQIKEAAEKFTVLQVGLACASKDADGAYTIKTYNIPLSPVLDEELEVQRDFAFQSGAVQFLNRNGFDFGQSISHGVQFLSHDEEAQAMQNALQKMDRSQIQDIQLSETDVEALAFVAQIRLKINHFLSTRDNATSHPIGGLNSFDITSRTDATGKTKELSGFDRRLVHQLERAEYPKLVTMSRSGFMTIRILNADREAEHRARRLDRAKMAVRNHVGFRRVIDALCGQSIGDLDCYRPQIFKNGYGNEGSGGGGIELSSLASSPNSARNDSFELARQHARVTAALKKQRPAIVGHNILNDLIYMHRSFIGPLPTAVTAFAQSIRTYFPVVVDTKYLVTHNCGAMNPASSLAKMDEELALEALLDEKLSLEPKHPERQEQEEEHSGGVSLAPKRAPPAPIKTELGFDKYAAAESLHEAGYDAFITARVFIRMAAKLKQDGAVPEWDDNVWAEYGNRLRVFGTHESVLEV